MGTTAVYLVYVYTMMRQHEACAETNRQHK